MELTKPHSLDNVYYLHAKQLKNVDSNIGMDNTSSKKSDGMFISVPTTPWSAVSTPSNVLDVCVNRVLNGGVSLHTLSTGTPFHAFLHYSAS